MAFTRALYYPRIEIPDEGWLKTAILYWDEIQTIVPASMPEPYSSPTARALFEAHVLSPLRVHPDMPNIERLAEKVIDYFSSPEAECMLRENGVGEYELMHPEKLPEIRDFVHLHPEKLPWEVQHRLRRFFQGIEGGWLRVHPAFARYYMTLLATELSESSGLGLLTDMPSSDRLSSLARLEGPLGLSNFRMLDEYPRRYARRRFVERVPGATAQGILAELTLNRVAVASDTPVERILQFREDHKAELGRFRTKLADLTKSIELDLPMEALQQQVSDMHANEVEPGIRDLKDALRGSRIKWAVESFMKTSFLSVPTGSVLFHVGLAMPQALLASAGISLIASAVLYNSERRNELRGNPFSYVLAAETEFGG